MEYHLLGKVQLAKNMRHYFSVWLFTIAVMVFGGTFPSLANADISSGTIVLLPFESKNSGRYDALKDGLRIMLAGQLSLREGITVLDAAFSDSEQASFMRNYSRNKQSALAKFSADYLGGGTMSVTDEGLRLVMKVYAKDGKRPQKFTVIAKNDSTIIEAVGQLADEIAEKIFGYPAANTERAEFETSGAGVEAFQTAHPDRKYKEEIISGGAVLDGEKFATIPKDDLVRRRSSLAVDIIALALGDVDGEGDEEIVVASEKNLKIFRYKQGLLQQFSSYSLPKQTKVHALNIADLDGDDIAEIYISATRANRFSSLILTWTNSHGFTEKQSDIRWAIRPITTPEGRQVLLGQAKSKKPETFFEPGIFVLEGDENSNRLAKGKKMPVPQQLNLFDFVYGDIDGDGVIETVGITNNLKLAVFDQENRLSWMSQVNYGGSVKYLGKRWRAVAGDTFGNAPADDENYTELQYVPPRMVAKDVNGDGKTDIIGVKNKLSTFELLTNFRGFSGGNVVCLTWDGIEMQEMWQTDLLDGYISDIDFLSYSSEIGEGDVGEDADLAQYVRLVIGQVPSGGFTGMFNFLGEKANLLVYDFRILANTLKLNDESP